MDISSFDYKNIYKFFLEISNVPRGSGHNEKINGYLVNFARSNNLEYYTDKALNVLIKKPASKGYENTDAVIIQGHMDMVCLCADGYSHDFTNEPLKLKTETVNGIDYICADGTTLGGDDGIAVAMGLALLSDANLKAPAIELLLTTDEETSMVGAREFDYSKLSGTKLINIDSEEDGTVISGCAGGMSVNGYIDIERSVKNGAKFSISITSLLGGHSGEMIGLYRTNANILMGRLLMSLKRDIGFSILSVRGGLKDNAIPDSCGAELVVGSESIENFKSLFKDITGILSKELSDSEPALKFSCDSDGKIMDYSCLNDESANKAVFILNNAPDGVQVMSHSTPGFVESSLNLGIIDSDEKTVYFKYLIRSSKQTYIDYISDKLAVLFFSAAGDMEIAGSYEPWEFCEKSPLRDLYIRKYTGITGSAPKVKTIHAGLECSIFAKKFPMLDIISIGPDILDIHTPKERLNIASGIHVYKILEAMLEAM